jgi:hypothetical protein
VTPGQRFVGAESVSAVVIVSPRLRDSNANNPESLRVMGVVSLGTKKSYVAAFFARSRNDQWV